MNHNDRKHFAFFCLPLYGHVKPTLGLVEELVSRGHRVSYFVADRLAATVAETGARVLSHESVFHQYSLPLGLLDAIVAFAEEGYAPLPAAMELFEQDPPDVVAYDVLTSETALAVARRYEVPSVRLYAGFGGNEHVGLGQLGPPTAEPDVTLDPADPRLVSLGEQVDGLIAAAGAEQFVREQPTAEEAKGDLNIVFVPREFQLAAETFDDSYVFAGPCFRAAEFTGGWQPPGDGRPIVLVTMGTTSNQVPEFFRSCVTAFGELPWHVVMTIGRDGDRAALGPLPPNVEVHEWLDQHAVLEHASLFVCQGGAGSTMQGLYWGVPMVIVASGDDTVITAHQVAELGLGRSLSVDTVTADSLCAAAKAVMADETARANARAMSAHVRESGGAAHTADRLEALISGGADQTPGKRLAVPQ
ncbi:macrolide-inactivating glycosyltransferase [Kutzneria viridogrisea]|uniref:MGT family glycosyltransferase n=1 Tax=Kutzneria viridogrisea TaxID=47990 RepID=A0ABR6BET6_9PSEU|nr:MGT family glycosyltransferase [Kutzneria viridogrisea]